MSNKPTLKVGHIRITDHLVLGVTKDKVDRGEESLQYSNLKTECFVGLNPLAKALSDGKVDAAFILAPLAMELFHAGTKMKLVSFGHRAGSVIIKNNRAEIETITDFKDKTVSIRRRAVGRN